MADTVRILVQPRASRTDVVGPHGDEIRIRLAAPPVDGAANKELVRFLARRLRVPRQSITIVSGTSSRHKRIRVSDLSAAAIIQRLLGPPAR